jgi:hypothetical protein
LWLQGFCLQPSKGGLTAQSLPLTPSAAIVTERGASDRVPKGRIQRNPADPEWDFSHGES